jgi:FtsP/CotA-like multicopper oxidase with cupredoxin domain
MALLLIIAALAFSGDSSVQPPTVVSAAISANDNRVAAGTMVHGVLHLSIDARWGEWHPDGDAQPGVPMQAFGEAGKPLQIPGPLIRIPVGTEVELQLRNLIPSTVLTVHGLVDRPANADNPVNIPFGGVRLVRFRAGVAGTYSYWATTTNAHTIVGRFGWDSQLSGAIVADTAHDAKDGIPDRIFVIGTWDNVYDASNVLAVRYTLETFNGLAWPYTERLAYAQGATVHWRWINAGAVPHPLHLHGFFFHVASRGDGITDLEYPEAERDLEVTELVRAGGTFTMTWQADRPGNWLFHCHIPAHTVAHLPLADMVAGKPVMSIGQYVNEYVPHAEMGDMVLGITVHPTGSWRVPTQPIPKRHLALVVDSAPDNTSQAPSFRYTIREGDEETRADSQVGPPLVLTQGVPVAIDVVNHLSEATSVHWHGMELSDSFYDGASGISGYGNRIAPAIEPGATFRVQFTPSRAGTFIYHTHLHDQWQFRGGLAGPLIVVPAGSRFDPTVDHVVMLTSPNTVSDILTKELVNGYRDPPPLIVHAGVPQRFRLINVVVANQQNVVSLESSSGPVFWRAIAIDGADLPPARQTTQPADQTLTIGKTLDFEFTPAALGDLLFVVRAKPKGLIVARLTVRVI